MMKQNAQKLPVIDMEDEKKEYPVMPLIIPNNCRYDQTTNTMSIDTTKSRNELKPYPPAIAFIRSISSKIATISIAGRARTGKSLVAGELYAPKHIPCPFDLGHTMDACTYGVWVTAKPIPHPHQHDTVILIFDVEGTGFYENTKRNDMQLMVITLLISSYFVYNTQGTFTSSDLDQLEFVTELAERIQLKPNEDDGNGLEYILPKFMWLLRDQYLQPTLNDQKVSVRDYFTRKVLKYEKGKNKVIQKRQNVRSVFMQTFRDYDAYTLPIPHADKDMLQQLGAMKRDQLQPEFNQQLQTFCDKVIQEAQCKVLFIQTQNAVDDDYKDEDEDDEDTVEIDQYIRCRGSHLAGWIEECVKYVNDPNKVPQISSMTATVMSSVFRESKRRAVEQYRQLLFDVLKHLKGDDEEKALDEQDIIDSHLNIWNQVLTESGYSLQSFYNDVDDEKAILTRCNDADRVMNEVEKEQFKVYFELTDEIGHSSDVTKLGATGLLNQVLTRNMELSTKACNTYLNEYFNDHFKALLDAPDQHEATEMVEEWKTLFNEYYKECHGPAQRICWAQFENERKRDSIEQFKKMKGYSDGLAQQQGVIMQNMKQINDLEIAGSLLVAQKEQQQQLHDEEVGRINEKLEEQKQEFETASKELKKKANDAEFAKWSNLAMSVLNTGINCYSTYQKHKLENEKVAKLEKKVNKMKKKNETLNKKVNEIENQQVKRNDEDENADQKEDEGRDENPLGIDMATIVRYGVQYGPMVLKAAEECLIQ